MKLGFNEATCMKKSSLEMDLELCERYGYDYIEIRLDMLQEYLKNNTIEDLKKFFKHSHLKPYALNSIEDINFCSADSWNELVKLFKFACEVASEINNPYIVVVPTRGDDMRNKSEEEVFRDSVEVLNKLSDIAEPYGVKLAFEPIGSIKWCVRSIRQAWEIIKEVDRENVGIALDAFNIFIYDMLSDIHDLDLIPGEKIFVYHINDCEDRKLEDIREEHRLMPGDGIIPLDEISSKLKSKGYEGIASIELFRPEYWEMEPEDVIRLGSQKAKPYL